MIQTRNVVQVRTHAQKYFQKLERSKQQEQMSDEDGNPTGNVIGPVSVSIAEKSSISIADLSSVIKASSSGSVSTAGEVKTTSKRKRKVNRDFVEDDDKDSAKLTISLKKERKANKTKRTADNSLAINYFTQHIPLHIPRRSLNKPKPIPDYLPD